LFILQEGYEKQWKITSKINILEDKRITNELKSEILCVFSVLFSLMHLHCDCASERNHL